jgi:Ni/Fe-hydrogenase subunit HybB-like protein
MSAHMTGHEHPRPIGGKLVDRPMLVLLAIFGVAAVVMAYRFFVGVGPVSNMTDGFTWGIWEPVNVVVFTGIGAGAYGVGLLCYLLNQGRYHALVRPAVLVGAICYSLGGSSIVVALGRYWNAYLLPWVPFWNLGSALLEVAVCVMMYVMVLWVEVLPSIFDGAAQAHSPRWAAWGKRWGGRLAKAMPFIIALAMLLPTMHQSSLGGLMLIAGPKIHPLWHTALLPTLFLISCLSMGFGAVVALTNLLHLSWKAKHDQQLLADMSKVNGGLLLLYAVVRLVDLAAHGKLRYLGLDFYTALFLFEMALFVVPGILFFRPAVQQNRGRLFGAALLALAAGAFYRVDTYLSVYRPAPGWEYWPSLGETTVTLGMAAIGIAVFIFVSRLFPVVVVEERHEQVHTPLRAASGH